MMRRASEAFCHLLCGFIVLGAVIYISGACATQANVASPSQRPVQEVHAATMPAVVSPGFAEPGWLGSVVSSWLAPAVAEQNTSQLQAQVKALAVAQNDLKTSVDAAVAKISVSSSKTYGFDPKVVAMFLLAGLALVFLLLPSPLKSKKTEVDEFIRWMMGKQKEQAASALTNLLQPAITAFESKKSGNRICINCGQGYFAVGGQPDLPSGILGLCPACVAGPRQQEPLMPHQQVRRDGQKCKESQCDQCGYVVHAYEIEKHRKPDGRVTCPGCGHPGQPMTDEELKKWEPIAKGVPQYNRHCPKCLKNWSAEEPGAWLQICPKCKDIQQTLCEKHGGSKYNEALNAAQGTRRVECEKERAREHFAERMGTAAAATPNGIENMRLKDNRFCPKCQRPWFADCDGPRVQICPSCFSSTVYSAPKSFIYTCAKCGNAYKTINPVGGLAAPVCPLCISGAVPPDFEKFRQEINSFVDRTEKLTGINIDEKLKSAGANAGISPEQYHSLQEFISMTPEQRVKAENDLNRRANEELEKHGPTLGYKLDPQVEAALDSLKPPGPPSGPMSGKPPRHVG